MATYILTVLYSRIPSSQVIHDILSTCLICSQMKYHAALVCGLRFAKVASVGARKWVHVMPLLLCSMTKVHVHFEQRAVQ